MSSFPIPVVHGDQHRWELRLEEFEEGHVVRRFECVECGAVRFD
ncbi:hypothetical protein [Nocardioides dilutus]